MCPGSQDIFRSDLLAGECLPQLVAICIYGVTNVLHSVARCSFNVSKVLILLCIHHPAFLFYHKLFSQYILRYLK